VGRFTKALTETQWRDASYWTLLAHCNHGDGCDTFTDADHLNTFTDIDMDGLVTLFVEATKEERLQKKWRSARLMYIKTITSAKLASSDKRRGLTLIPKWHLPLARSLTCFKRLLCGIVRCTVK
jgi:hypothetical protein